MVRFMTDLLIKEFYPTKKENVRRNMRKSNGRNALGQGTELIVWHVSRLAGVQAAHARGVNCKIAELQGYRDLLSPAFEAAAVHGSRVDRVRSVQLFASAACKESELRGGMFPPAALGFESQWHKKHTTSSWARLVVADLASFLSGCRNAWATSCQASIAI